MRLLIGYGSSLHSDDGIGPCLAEALGEGWSVITCVQLLPELSEPISRAEGCVFIDAKVGEIPGQIQCEQVHARPADSAFSHTVSPASLLAMAQSLYDAAPPAHLITVTGASFGLSESLSPELKSALQGILATVGTMLKQLSQAEQPDPCLPKGPADD